VPATQAYLGGLEREWELRGLVGDFATAYVGGGTPSMLGAQGLDRLLSWMGARLGDRPLAEWTVELNPEHVDEGLLAVLVDRGVDRVSLGVQTFQDRGLAQLGRVHDADRAKHAVRLCVEHGLRTSVDLIVGWPGQTTAELDDDLSTATQSGAEHLSVYALTIEPDTPWIALVRRGLRVLPDPDRQGNVLERAANVLEATGWTHYEVASYARGDAVAQHNLAYWTWRNYVGLGPSAASASFHVDGSVLRRTNSRGVANWLEDPGAGPTERLTGQAAAAEGLWTGLRYLEGIDVASFLARFPQVDGNWLEQRVSGQVKAGNLEWTGDSRVLRVTTGRWLWHDTIAAAIL